MPIDPLVGGAIVGGVGKLISNGIGAIFGSNNTKATNKMNYKIAKEQMAWQSQMQDKQNAWNLEQWNRENAYNSAAAQVQRYREAGINPALAMTSGATAGMAGSLQSASPASAPNMPQMQPFQPNFSEAGDAFSQMGQIPLLMAERDNLNADSAAKTADSALKIAQKSGQETANDVAKVELDILRKTQDYRIERENLLNDSIHAKTRLDKLDYDTKTILNRLLPIDKQMSWMQSLGDFIHNVVLARSVGEITPHQIEEIKSRISDNLASSFMKAAQTLGIKLNNDFLAQTLHGRISQFFDEAYITENEANASDFLRDTAKWSSKKGYWDYMNAENNYWLDAGRARDKKRRFMASGSTANIWRGLDDFMKSGLDPFSGIHFGPLYIEPNR